LGKLQSKFKELEDSSLTLLLDSLTSLLLDLNATSEDDDVTLDDPSAGSASLLLLDFSDDSDFTELDDSSAIFSSFEDEDFAFTLLDETSSAGSTPLEDDSASCSSLFGPEDDESSPHPTNANAATPIATRNFFINPPVIRHDKFKANVIYFT
jgi:hypothetical protein